MEKLNQGKNDHLNYLISILFILSGGLFDIADIFTQVNFNTWTDIHLALKDLQFLGFALLSFTLCPYSKLKIKALTFMLTLWRTLVLITNNVIVIDPSIINASLVPVYTIYIIFLHRIVRLNDWPPVFLNSKNYEYIKNTTKSFNVLLPIGTFRGLLQILFTRSSPKYETRLMVSGGFIYSVQHNRFVKQDYDSKIIKDLMEKAGARIKLLGFISEEERIDKYESLLGKRTFTGVRDCRRLEG